MNRRIKRALDDKRHPLRLAAAACALAFAAQFSASPCLASFHFMQIEKVVGGVNGDPKAQAIQLRMRAPAQEQVNRGKLIAWDSNGENPVVVMDFETTVRNFHAGARILIASREMRAYADSSFVETFTMEQHIPESYLSAGSLTFENDEETLIVWRFSWGGAAYTGDTAGALTNDDDREFGPPFPGPLPVDGLETVEFSGDYSDKSTSNAADYALSTGAGVLTNNSDDSFTLTIPDCDDPEGPGPDADGDGVRDVCDECDGDSDKTEPGTCGCGIPETDTDDDGTPDCHDPDNGGVPPDNDNDNDNDNTNSNDNDNENENDNAGNDNDDPDDDNDNGNGGPSGNGNGGGGGPTRSPCSPGVGGILLALLGWCGLRFTRRATAL